MDHQHNPYASAAFESDKPTVPPAGQKPTSATVFGVLHLIFGIMGLLSMPVNLVTLFVMNSDQLPANPALDIMRDTPGYMAYLQASMVIGLVMSIVLVAAGVGLLKGRPYGRTLSIYYCWTGLVIWLLGAAANLYFLLGPLSKLGGFEALGAMIGTVVGLIVGPIYPIITLVFMYRPVFVEYFRQQAQGGKHG